MTWAELKLLVKNRLQFDGVSQQDINNTAIASAFDLRAILYLQSFMRDTYYIYEDRAALTLATNDRILNLLDPAKSAKAIYHPRKVWVNSSELQLYSISDQEQMYSSAVVATGTPTTWASAQEGQIQFEVKCTSGFSNSFVSGWAKHPTISSDSQSLSVLDWDGLICSAYIAAAFAQPVVSSNAGLNRLQMYDKEAYEGAKEIKARNLARFYGSGYLG